MALRIEFSHNGRLLRFSEQYVQDIKAVTIDLDDTLWAISPVIQRAEAALQNFFASRYPRVIEQFPPHAVQELREQVFFDNATHAHDLTFIRKTVIGRMAVAAGYNDELVDEAFEVFDAARNTLEPFPDVADALNLISARYKLIAVTNGNADLERIGLAEPFDDVVSACMAGAAKPAAAIFTAAIRAGGAPAGDTLHVGDHPEHDVAGARSAGMRTAWVNRDSVRWPGGIKQADVEVADLRQLAELLCGGGAG